jgi:hypothetical protein
LAPIIYSTVGVPPKKVDYLIRTYGQLGWIIKNNKEERQIELYVDKNKLYANG